MGNWWQKKRLPRSEACHACRGLSSNTAGRSLDNFQEEYRFSQTFSLAYISRRIRVDTFSFRPTTLTMPKVQWQGRFSREFRCHRGGEEEERVRDNRRRAETEQLSARDDYPGTTKSDKEAAWASRGTNSEWEDDGRGDEEEGDDQHPYIQGTSEAIWRMPGQLGKRTAMRSSKIKWSIMKGVKDKQKEEEIPGVVYAIGCGDCRKAYVGETRRTAAQRVKEHKSDTRLGHLDKLAVAEHAHTTGHHVHWKAMVVEREQHGRKRKVKDALHIHRMTRKDGSMNQDRGLHLCKIWLDL